MTSLEIGQLKLIKQDIEAILSHEGDDVGEFDPGECLYQIFKKANNAKQIISSLSEPTIEPKEVSAEEDYLNKIETLLGYLDVWVLGRQMPFELGAVMQEAKEFIIHQREGAVREQAQKEGDGVVAGYTRQDVINAWDSAYGGDSFLSGEDCVASLVNSDKDSVASHSSGVGNSIWQDAKPVADREMVFVTAHKAGAGRENEWDYKTWQILLANGVDENDNEAYYWALCNEDGEEWGPYEDLEAQKYLILPPITTHPNEQGTPHSSSGDERSC